MNEKIVQLKSLKMARILTLFCVIVGGWGGVGSNKMQQGGNYQDFLKWWGGGGGFLGHSVIKIKWT